LPKDALAKLITRRITQPAADVKTTHQASIGKETFFGKVERNEYKQPLASRDEAKANTTITDVIDRSRHRLE
jgi:hypothetical protein